jgi:hypothetical protein
MVSLFVAGVPFPRESYCTSIVVLITHHGIVIGGDGKVSIEYFRSRSLPRRSFAGEKIAVLQNRIVLANAGIESLFGEKATPYSFHAMVEEVTPSLSDGMTVREFVEVLRKAILQKFVGFDVALKNAIIKREDLPPPGDMLFKYFVVGYDGKVPQAFQIDLAIDWRSLHLKEPTVIPFYPDPSRKNIMIRWVGGEKHGIIELRNPQSEVTKKAYTQIPIEIKALLGDQNLTLQQTLVLACGLLNIEAYRNRNVVGYPFTIISIPINGKLEKRTYQHSCQNGLATR